MSGAERPRREGVGKMGQRLDHPRPLGREENTRDCPETGGALQLCFYLAEFALVSGGSSLRQGQLHVGGD